MLYKYRVTLLKATRALICSLELIQGITPVLRGINHVLQGLFSVIEFIGCYKYSVCLLGRCVGICRIFDGGFIRRVVALA